MSNSKLEERFLTLLLELAPNTIVLREFAAIDGRRFRFDFCLPASAILVECQGGVYTGGRHTRGVGMEADSEKSRLAQMQGYCVFAYTGKQITKANVQALLEFAKEREKTIKRKRKPTQDKKQEYNNDSNRKKTNVRKQRKPKTPAN